MCLQSSLIPLSKRRYMQRENFLAITTYIPLNSNKNKEDIWFHISFAEIQWWYDLVDLTHYVRKFKIIELKIGAFAHLLKTFLLVSKKISCWYHVQFLRKRLFFMIIYSKKRITMENHYQVIYWVWYGFSKNKSLDSIEQFFIKKPLSI